MTSMSSEELMTRYLIAREKERQDAFERSYEKLTEREQRLVREAAVMGHALGVQASGGHIPKESYPKDSAVLRDVLLACQQNPDLYPYMASLDT